ncbi:hypothetical protein QFC24_006974 [Naganishia onofrii]|uniref:Uncharacterized protein n=1 Tax=Naganishia onofrii TaxID=1851511 RepID=A0ACC2WUA2_9TREE|nr:hypothetical protein QFC24_006974 [Naganishia onofrii]
MCQRERQSNTAVLPIASNVNNTGYYPPSNGYNNGYTANNDTAQTGYNAPSGGADGGAAASYYNNDAPQMSEAYTKPPQQAYYPSGQGEYAPPSGAPPTGGYGGGGYAPPSGAPPTGYSR